MTLTFLDIYNECAGQPWSMFDNDAESIDDFESAMRISINKAISYLWNLQPWSFRKTTTTIKTRAGVSAYSLPNGLIERKTINGEIKYRIKYNGKFLDYVPDYEVLDEKDPDEPKGFYIDGETLYIYPTPDSSYILTINYLLLPYGLNEDDEEIYELKEDTDYINIPEKFETLFKNCLISLAMMYAIAEETDENYTGYKRQYEDALATMIKYCMNRIVDRNVVW